jgi:hypothetical protein
MVSLLGSCSLGFYEITKNYSYYSVVNFRCNGSSIFVTSLYKNSAFHEYFKCDDLGHWVNVACLPEAQHYLRKGGLLGEVLHY